MDLFQAKQPKRGKVSIVQRLVGTTSFSTPFPITSFSQDALQSVTDGWQHSRGAARRKHFPLDEQRRNCGWLEAEPEEDLELSEQKALACILP
jgi:hypothetical protein